MQSKILDRLLQVAQAASVVLSVWAVIGHLLVYPLALAAEEWVSDGFLLVMIFFGFFRAAWSVSTLVAGGLALLLLLIVRLKRGSWETVNKPLTVAAVAAPLIVNALMRILGGDVF